MLIFISSSLTWAVEKTTYQKKVKPQSLREGERRWTYRFKTTEGELYLFKAKKCHKVKSFIGKRNVQKPACIALASIKEAMRLGKTLRIQYSYDEDFQRELKVARVVEARVPLKGYDVQTNSSFRPTNLKSYEQAQRILSTFKEAKKSSQCYQRAYRWNYDMNQEFGVKSERIYLFFSKRFRYRPDYKYKWWFHIAPVVTVNGEKFVMDPVFSNGPAPVQDWLDLFMCKKRGKKINPYTGKRVCLESFDPCQKIDHYGVYEDNQYSRHCYYRVTNMYHWQPRDVKKADNESRARSSWNYEELEMSIKNAFRPERPEYE